MTKGLNKYSHFNIEKIIQVLAYIQRKTGTRSKLELIKYLFFADRINIRRHFSFISRDYYYALKLGPVASETLDVLDKHDEYLNYPENELRLLDKIEVKDSRTRIINETNTDLLSKNEMKSIDFVTDTFKSSMPLVELTHEYPEWKRYKELFDNKQASKLDVQIEDFFTNPDLNSSPYLMKHLGKDPLYEDEMYLDEAKKFYLAEMAL
ncbi:MAG: SocA family protein [Treponema sp.]|jgi:hypothetical protein|nr:SocA family protein [Treponema sp.]